MKKNMSNEDTELVPHTRNYQQSILTIKMPEELQMLVTEYFSSCRFPTYAGLARAIGVSRHDLLKDQYDTKFRSIILDAKQRIEEFLEEYLLYGHNPTAAQFLLKNNFNYTEKVELDHKRSITDFLAEG